jgi:hypothetical protein
MEVTMGFTAVSQNLFVEDNLSSLVNLAGQSVTAILDVTGGWNTDSEQLGAEIFVEQGSVAGGGKAFSGLFENITNLYNSSTSSATNSGCVTLTVTIPSGVTSTGSYSGYSVLNGPIDPSVIEVIGVAFYTSASGSGFGNTIVDIKSWLY